MIMYIYRKNLLQASFYCSSDSNYTAGVSESQTNRRQRKDALLTLFLIPGRSAVAFSDPGVLVGRCTHSGLPAENNYNNPGFIFLCHKSRNMEVRKMAVTLILKERNPFLISCLTHSLNTITPFGH